MRVEITDDVDKWAAAVSTALGRQPVENNLLLSLALERGGGQLAAGAATYAWLVNDADEIVGAARVLAPFPMTVSELPDEACQALASELHARGVDPSGVNGPAATAAAFAAEWTRLTGQASSVTRRSQLLRLDTLIPAPQPSGAARPADASDRDQIAEWFAQSVGGSGLSPEQARGHAGRMVDAQLAAGRLVVWEVDGEVIGAAGWAQPVAGVARPRPIFVRPDRRGGGHARALVAAVSERALADGATCCMCYSDLAYAAMTTILEQVGYTYIHDVHEYRFA